MADYGDPRERLVGPDGVPMNHVVALKRDRATGANLLVATTGAGALGLFALRGRDIVPLVATAPEGTADAAAAATATAADADVQTRRSQRSQTVCGEQPDAATAGYNPAQFQAITSIEDIRNILMPRRVCHFFPPFFALPLTLFFPSGRQSRLGEDVATPSPLATSCRLPRCERTHERRRSQHRKSLSSAEDYSKTRGSGSEGTTSRDEPAAAAGGHHSHHAHSQRQ